MVNDATQDVVVREAFSLFSNGQMQQAANILRSVCNEQNTNPEQWFLYGAALGNSGNLAAAELAFRKALELSPGYSQARASLGKALFDLGRFEEAVEQLQQALAANTENRPVRIALVSTLIQLKRFAEAERLCTEQGQGKPDSAELKTSLGIIRMIQGRLNEAIALFDQALTMQPASLRALINKGLTLKSAGQLDAAIKHFKHAIKLAPKSAAAWEQLALTLLKQGDMVQAASCLETAFQINPGNVRAGRQLANVYRHMRKTSAAADIYRRILEVRPDDVRARFFFDAYRDQEAGVQPERIPADCVQAIYSGRDTGIALEASLTGALEYRAPAVLNEAVREVCHVPETGLDILEVGCGTGLCGSQLADIAHSLVGTDLSVDLLAVAREKNTYDNLFVADLVDVLSDNPAAFDLVVAMDVLCFFGDLTDIFRKCHRTLRESGIFALSVGKPESAALWELHPYGHFVHSLYYLQTVAKETGFVEIYTKEITLRREMNEDRVGYVCLFRRI